MRLLLVTMTPAPPSLGLRRTFAAFVFLGLTVAAAVDGATDSEIALLREELTALRSQYESRIDALESRLAELESAQITTAAAAPSSPPTPHAAGEVIVSSSPVNVSRISDEFDNDTEVRNRARAAASRLWADRVEEVLQDYIEINGYFRAGYGRNDQGGPQVGFKAPGAFAKPRLGNEPENFGEIVFGKNFYVPGTFTFDRDRQPLSSASGPVAFVQFRMDFFNPYEEFSRGDATTIGLPEAWASIANVLPDQPTAKIWAGNRFYRRHDIGLNDFFFWNMSGGGGGIEDLNIGSAKFAAAWIGNGATSGFSDLPSPDPENEAGFSKSNLDLRVYDLPFAGGNAEIGLIYSRARSGLDSDGNQSPTTDGFALNVVHTKAGFISEDGQNKLTFQYGSEAAKTFTSGFETFSRPDGEYIRPDRPDSWRFRVTDNFSANLNDSLSLGAVALYQYTDYGAGFGTTEWVELGLRPIIHFNEYLSLALEGGWDWVRDEAAGTSDSLYKFTIAPQVSLGGRYNSRPVIRAFATWATWGDDFLGQVGGQDYANETHGSTFGVQMETWW